MKKIPCKHCNSEFFPEYTNQKYCSKICYSRAKNKRNWQKNHPERQREPKRLDCLKICPQCQISFKARKDQKYCSLKCNGDSKKKYFNIPDCLENPERKIDKNLGYVRIYIPMHPEANTWGYAYEHRIIAEQKIGRRLEPGEIVHHKDRIRWNNDPDNLEVMTEEEHGKLHGSENKKAKS